MRPIADVYNLILKIDMNTTALILMVCTMSLVAATAGLMFYKVLTTPPKPEPDSYTDNDDDPR